MLEKMIGLKLQDAVDKMLAKNGLTRALNLRCVSQSQDPRFSEMWYIDTNIGENYRARVKEGRVTGFWRDHENPQRIKQLVVKWLGDADVWRFEDMQRDPEDWFKYICTVRHYKNPEERQTFTFSVDWTKQKQKIVIIEDIRLVPMKTEEEEKELFDSVIGMELREAVKNVLTAYGLTWKENLRGINQADREYAPTKYYVPTNKRICFIAEVNNPNEAIVKRFWRG